MSGPLTPERLAVLRVLCKAATQGERVNVWDEIAGQPDDTLEEIVVRTTDGRRVIGLGWHDGLHSFCSRADAAHIAAFDPTTCEALLDAADDLARVRERVGQLEAGAPSGCPCNYTTPCQHGCTCAMPHSSRGCRRCAVYGSPEQQRGKAEMLARIIDDGLAALVGGKE